MGKEIALSVRGVCKEFRLHNKGSIKSKIIDLFRSNKPKKEKLKMTNDILNNVSFEVEKGDFFGIVGRNGSGKSTLLKIIAGIYTPDSGEVIVNGKLVPFIELGVGFNHELSGKDNVYLNAALLGFTRSEVDTMYDEIVEFAELRDFMNEKLKNYSSGMQVRLAFSIAIKAQADILVLDEVLAVGDEAFQRKCYQYFAEMQRNKQTVIFVSHSMDAVQRFCNKAMLLDKGHKTVLDTPLKVAQLYRELNDKESTTEKTPNINSAEASNKNISADFNYRKVRKKHVFEITLTSKINISDPLLAFGVYKDSGEQVYHWASEEKIPYKFIIDNGMKLRIELEDIFPVGVFVASLFVRKQDRTMSYAVFNEFAKFEVKNLTQYQYSVHWKIPETTYINGKEIKNVH